MVGAGLKSLIKFLPGFVLFIESEMTESGLVVRVCQPGPLGLLLAELGEKVDLRRSLLERIVSGFHKVPENFFYIFVLAEFPERNRLVVSLDALRSFGRRFRPELLSLLFIAQRIISCCYPVGNFRIAAAASGSRRSKIFGKLYRRLIVGKSFFVPTSGEVFMATQ